MYLLKLTESHGVYTHVCIYYKHVVVFTYVSSIVYDWSDIYRNVTVRFIRVDRCEIHAVHDLLSI